MQTIDKAAGLLSHFSEKQTEIGLTALARLSGNDKASVRRCLLSFMKHGLIEQNETTKAYRLGREVLRLARVREVGFPLSEVAGPLLAQLRDETGETAHLSILAGSRLATMAVEESKHANRISFVLGEESPIHASGTGLAVLAFSSEKQRNFLWPSDFKAFTDKTPIDDQSLQAQIRPIRKLGYSLNEGLLETGLSSMAAPLIDASGDVIGAFGVAAPTTRFGGVEQAKCARHLAQVAREACLALGMPKNWEPQ